MPVSWRDAATSAIIDDTTTADMADTDTGTAVTVDTVDTADTVGTEVTATDWDTEAAKKRLKGPRLPLNLPLLHPIINITRPSIKLFFTYYIPHKTVSFQIQYFQ